MITTPRTFKTAKGLFDNGMLLPIAFMLLGAKNCDWVVFQSEKVYVAVNVCDSSKSVTTARLQELVLTGCFEYKLMLVAGTSGGSPEKVGDEAVDKEWDDSLERAATTATSLDAEQLAHLDEESLGENTSKQGRIDDAYAKVTLVDETSNDADKTMFDVKDCKHKNNKITKEQQDYYPLFKLKEIKIYSLGSTEFEVVEVTPEAKMTRFFREDVKFLKKYLFNDSKEFHNTHRCPVTQVYHPIYDQDFKILPDIGA
ncbi:hypothetical protein Tco_0236894 [Tanacetum coccineum]